jgi:ketosteroid isomerase-like protein
MPVVTHHRALILQSSPPPSPVGRSSSSSLPSIVHKSGLAAVPVLTEDPPSSLHHLLLIPFELKNGCSEEGLVVESDNVTIINALRKHYLVHFGHRDIEALVQEYHPQAVIVQKHNLVLSQEQQQQQHRSSFHGHDQIRSAFRDVFEMHPTVNSTFQLKEIVVENNGRTARVMWSATTPTHTFGSGCDTFQFDAHGKIAKQVVTCEMEHVTSPWYETDA